MDVELKGARELAAKLEASKREVREACKSGLWQAGNHLMNMSRDRFTPVDTGALKASGHVDPAKEEGFGRAVSVKLWFGGVAAPYAVYVHERTDLHHTHGQAKFLEAPVKMLGPSAFRVYLDTQVKEALRRVTAR